MARTVLFLWGSSLLLMLWLSVPSIIFAEAEGMPAGDISPPVCLNCSLCGSCHPKSPPPPFYTLYAPPPPPVEADCPPSTPVACCDNPPPPRPYSDLPYYNYGAACPFLLPGLVFSSLCSVIPALLLCGVHF